MSHPVIEDVKMDYKQFVSTIENFDERYAQNITPDFYFGFPLDPILKIEEALLNVDSPNKAYFSMEYGIAPSIYNSFELKGEMSDKNQFFTHEVFSNYWLCDYLFKIRLDKMLDIPIYGGGLGVLAGDAMKSSADCAFPVAGLGILWNKGYFKQKFWYKHGQLPNELQWDPHSYPGLIPLTHRIAIETKDGPLNLRLWKYYVYSYDKKHACPIVLLDSNITGNIEYFRKLTDQLYRSDDVWWKILQRTILGIGGMKALGCLNYKIDRFHLNEGHAAFALIEKYVQLKNKDDAKDAYKNFVYTCHTPVAAGHDRFHINDVHRFLRDDYADAAMKFGEDPENKELINLTYMCLKNCSKINAVAQKHGDIMCLQFPDYANHIQAITNGVHMHTWISESIEQLMDKHTAIVGDWRATPEGLTKLEDLKQDEEFRRDLFEAHQKNKRTFTKVLRHWQLKEDVLTIGWARRIAGYKRPSLLFHDIEELVKIAKEVGPMQVILAGKAHPNDDIGSAHIEEILQHIDELNDHWKYLKVLILENYDTYFGKLLTSSVDVWLNNPLPPFEASGTSGMKAILNGVLQLTTLDGWVVEAAEDDIGWIFGYEHHGDDLGSEKDLRLDKDSKALYARIREVGELYYNTNHDGNINIKSAWIDKMIHCLERSAFFNTHRMMVEYNDRMWSK